MIITLDPHGNTWHWTPQSDITALELARLLPLLLRLTVHSNAGGMSNEITVLPDELRRHFTLVEAVAEPTEMEEPGVDDYIIWTGNDDQATD